MDRSSLEHASLSVAFISSVNQVLSQSIRE